MGRKNKRQELDLYLPPIKEEGQKRKMPKCRIFPDKAVFTTGYRAQVAIDEIAATSTRDKVPTRVYECELSEGGCGFFHITSQAEYETRNPQ